MNTTSEQTRSRSGEQTRFAAAHSVATIQRKLTVGAVNDPLEHQADVMADRVMRMSESAFVQRKCAACEDEDKLHRKPIASDITPFVQAKGSDGGDVSDAVAARINSSRGGGGGLPSSTRSFMESRFGADFSDVRVHTGTDAVQLSRDLNAQAFTVGRDVYFGQGKYSPESEGGRHLLAHELTHVIQQGAAGTHNTSAVSAPASSDTQVSRSPMLIQRLGANPGCTTAQADVIHQSIYDARGWVNNALRKLEATPPSALVLGSLRRNFGPTYGVAANISLIAGRVRTAYSEMATIPYGCADATDATCSTAPCGYTPVAGGHSAMICSNASLTPGADHIYQTGCVLHESFHSASTNFTVDHYSGWHGHSGSSPDYPGTGTDPLLNADSYTTLVIDLS